MKSDPMIVAAGPKPPRPTISVPAISGPMQAMSRGALNIKAMAVPSQQFKSSMSALGH